MRSATSILRMASAGFCVVSAFSSCFDPTLIQVPVTTHETRQKENYYYAPTSHNAPLLTDKNDLSASIQGSFGSHHSGLEMQAAFIPLQHFGLAAGYSAGDNNNGIMKYKRLTAAVGYVGSFTGYWHVEIYGGYNGGKIDNRYATGYSSIRNTGFFLQPAFFFYDKQRQKMQLGFVSKLTGTHFTVLSSAFSEAMEPLNSYQIFLMKNNTLDLFWEPGVVFRFGWENFLFHTGFSYSFNLNNSDMHYTRDNFSLGLHVKLNTGKKTGRL